MSGHSGTEKLYLKDPYILVFEAKLCECTRLDDGSCAAILDKTYFYPESGGQLCDRGRLAEMTVESVWEDDSGTVYHAVPEPLEPGPVRCEIDGVRRFDHMQQHTGQHVLSRAFIDVAGLHTVSFHMGEESCTIDLAGGALTAQIVDRAEALANSVIQENREVRVRTIPRKELDETLLRKLPEGAESVRLVEVTDFDMVGCCGTHVRRTGELGLIKLLKHEKAKGTERVYFKVGSRAVDDFRLKHDITKRIASRFTMAVEDIEEKIDKIESDFRACRKEVQSLHKRLTLLEAKRLLDEAILDGERRFIVAVLEDGSDEFVKHLSAQLKRYEKTISLIGSTNGLLICNASKDINIDLAQAVVDKAKRVGGSGGGKGGFASVRLPAGASVQGLALEILDILREG